ncbi:MAG: NmrA/HSCARG family protein [Chloroflexi bacterium]|nr:NmrA/HSCARG family protein [Chloroflexota bacterium]
MTQSTNNKRTILVLGATGQQGGATVDALLESGGWAVRAFTRDAQSDKAKALASRGVEVFQGDLSESETLGPAIKGAFGVFSIQVVMGDDAERIELQQGKNVADAAKAAGVAHIVHASAAGIGRRPGQAGGAKVAVEQYIRTTGVRCTFLHPTSFMENFRRARARIVEGTFAQALPGTVHQDYVSVVDIGRTVAEAFARPDDFGGQTVELVGDRLTMLETAVAFTNVLGRRVEFSQMGRDRVPPYMASLLEFLEANDGYGVSSPGEISKRWGLRLMTLEEWLRREGWASA